MVDLAVSSLALSGTLRVPCNFEPLQNAGFWGFSFTLSYAYNKPLANVMGSLLTNSAKSTCCHGSFIKVSSSFAGCLAAYRTAVELSYR